MTDFDPFEPALSLWRLLGNGDRCRFIDRCLLEMGEQAPIAAFEDIRSEADNWAAILDSRTKAIFMLAIFESLRDDDKAKTVEWLGKKMKREGAA